MNLRSRWVSSSSTIENVTCICVTPLEGTDLRPQLHSLLPSPCPPLCLCTAASTTRRAHACPLTPGLASVHSAALSVTPSPSAYVLYLPSSCSFFTYFHLSTTDTVWRRPQVAHSAQSPYRRHVTSDIVDSSFLHHLAARFPLSLRIERGGERVSMHARPLCTPTATHELARMTTTWCAHAAQRRLASAGHTRRHGLGRRQGQPHPLEHAP